MYKLLLGDCLETLKTLPDCSVQTCATSPPYYGLRKYLDDDADGKEYEIGLEQSPEEYIQKLVSVFREVRRVLKDDGVLWLNLGDSFWGGKGQSSQAWSTEHQDRDTLEQGQHQICGKGETRPTDGKHEVYKPKDLMMIPARVALALQADGWWLRSEIIWHKPNPMPESVTDRPTKSHEMIYLLAKSAHYFYDAEAIKEPANYPNDDRKGRAKEEHKSMPDGTRNGLRPGNYTYDMAFRNRRDVWTVTTKPYKEAHFATFPPDLIEPCILAGTSAKGECPKCGKAWVRVVEKKPSTMNIRVRDGLKGILTDKSGINRRNDEPSIVNAKDNYSETNGTSTTIGWQPQCECGLDSVPQTVLDPFNGSGTTGAVSIKHGRNYIGCELNPDYIVLTEKRLAEVQPIMI
jgi:DNA modification methylase